MLPRPPRTTRTDTLFPVTTLFRSEGMCGVTVAVDDGRVTTVRPNRDDAWSRGHICPKGTTLGALHHDPDRLRTPMVRDGDTWKSASYEAAFERLAMLVEGVRDRHRSEEHTSELQSLMRNSYAVFCLKKKIKTRLHTSE